MESYHLTSAQDNYTGELQQVGYMKFEDEAVRIMQFWLWASISVILSFVFYFLIRNFGDLPEDFHIGIPEIVIGLLTVAVTLITHELIHAFVMRKYGARAKFGTSRHNVVATITAPGYGFRRNSVILVALSPLIVLTCLALFGIWLVRGTDWVALFALIAIVNGGSTVGDIWIVGILLRYPSTAWTVDDMDGMRILLPME